MDRERASYYQGGVSFVSRGLRGQRARLYVILRRADDWKDDHRSRHTDVFHVIGELPTYGYRRVWALLRRHAALDGIPVINARHVYRNMRQNALLLKRKSAVPSSKRAHTGRVALKKAISCGALTRSSSVVIC
ncbi:IS3 family transposase [Escherichia coli]|nr:IS3 family transposase [Escherichia coli]